MGSFRAGPPSSATVYRAPSLSTPSASRMDRNRTDFPSGVQPNTWLSQPAQGFRGPQAG